MSITVVFVPNINIQLVLLNVISNLFDKKAMDEDNNMHVIFAFHGPKIADKTHLVNLLSSGYVNFIQVYDNMSCSIFRSEIDDKRQCNCLNVNTNFPAVGTLGTFLTNIWVLPVSCVNKQTGTHMTTPYFKPMKKLPAEYLMNCSPTTAFI